MHNNNNKVYFTTGEFAKLCNTTKETLFHYDEIALLKPELIKENGYRYYSEQQFWELDLIHVLQASGNSLKAIKEYMDSRNEENFLEMLKQNKEKLEEEKKRIEKMQFRLERAISVTRFAMNEQIFTPKRSYHKEEHLLTISVARRQLSESETVHYLQKHLAYCEEKGLYEEIPIGSIIPWDALERKDPVAAYLYSKINEAIEDKHYLLKPAGQYVTMLHKGFYDTISQSYDMLFTYIEENGLSICGNGYEYETISYFITKNRQEYSILIMIPIRS